MVNEMNTTWNVVTYHLAFSQYDFWRWVDGHCPSNMHHELCYKDFSYSIGDCPADFNQCYFYQSGNGEACPYNICRVSIESYSDACLKYLIVGLCCVLVLCIVTAVATATILYENDTLTSENRIYFGVVKRSDETDFLWREWILFVERGRTLCQCDTF